MRNEKGRRDRAQGVQYNFFPCPTDTDRDRRPAIINRPQLIDPVTRNPFQFSARPFCHLIAIILYSVSSSSLQPPRSRKIILSCPLALSIRESVNKDSRVTRLPLLPGAGRTPAPTQSSTTRHQDRSADHRTNNKIGGKFANFLIVNSQTRASRIHSLFTQLIANLPIKCLQVYILNVNIYYNIT